LNSRAVNDASFGWRLPTISQIIQIFIGEQATIALFPTILPYDSAL
jgi:hypothetical protein